MATRLESPYPRDYVGYITAGRCGVRGRRFISIDRCKYVHRGCEAAAERNGINASKLMKGLPASPVTDGNGTVTSGTGKRPGAFTNGPGFDSIRRLDDRAIDIAMKRFSGIDF